MGLEKIMCLFYRIYIEVIHRFYVLIRFLTVSEYEYIHDGRRRRISNIRGRVGGRKEESNAKNSKSSHTNGHSDDDEVQNLRLQKLRQLNEAYSSIHDYNAMLSYKYSK